MLLKHPALEGMIYEEMRSRLLVRIVGQHPAPRSIAEGADAQVYPIGGETLNTIPQTLSLALTLKYNPNPKHPRADAGWQHTASEGPG